MSLTALIGWVAQPGLIASLGSGKTELEGRVGYTYGTMIKRFCAMGWVFTGIILAAMVARECSCLEQSQRLADCRELAFGIAMQRLLPAWLARPDVGCDICIADGDTLGADGQFLRAGVRNSSKAVSPGCNRSTGALSSAAFAGSSWS